MRAIELLTAPARRWRARRRNGHLGSLADAVSQRQDVPQVARADVVPDRQVGEAAGDWSLAQRIAFRFFFAYFVIYSFPYPLSTIPGADKLFGPYHKIGPLVIPW